ncbi:ribonuclease P protein subunit p21 [Mobula birostris]|uniref:ribonuclease P protein subunit p21 n=1 Tax=Mobula birostris TaxID=1983395 RepID=UPI003B27CA16
MAGVKDRDAMLRVNFLYQAAHCVLAGNPDNSPLVRFYCHTQRSVCKRLVLRQNGSVPVNVMLLQLRSSEFKSDILGHL